MITLLEAQVLRTYRKLLETKDLLNAAAEKAAQEAENSQDLETPKEHN